METGKHDNSRLNNVYLKYGKPEIEVLKTCEIIELDKEEQVYLDLLFSDEFCCNLCPTASSTKGYKHTAESLKIIGEKSKLKVFSEEYRKKLRARKPNKPMLGKFHTDSAKLKMSQLRRGIPKSLDHRKKIGDSHRGEKHYNFGKSLSPAIKEKLSIAFRGGKNHKAQKAINLLTNKTYDCLKDAAEAAGVNYSTARQSRRNNKQYFLQYAN